MNLNLKYHALTLWIDAPETSHLFFSQTTQENSEQTEPESVSNELNFIYYLCPSPHTHTCCHLHMKEQPSLRVRKSSPKLLGQPDPGWGSGGSGSPLYYGLPEILIILRTTTGCSHLSGGRMGTSSSTVIPLHFLGVSSDLGILVGPDPRPTKTWHFIDGAAAGPGSWKALLTGLQGGWVSDCGS